MSEAGRPQPVEAAAPAQPEAATTALDAKLDHAIERLAQARPFAKPAAIGPVLSLARRRLLQPDGVDALYARAAGLDQAGIFAGTDWDNPQALSASFVGAALAQGSAQQLTLECISALRMLAIANGAMPHPVVSAEHARHFLTQVLAHNVRRVFAQAPDEAERQGDAARAELIHRLFGFLVAHVGHADILASVCEEIWRVLGQRPIQVQHARAMIAQIAVTLTREDVAAGGVRLGADRLINALFGPTELSRDDPGLPSYRERLAALDRPGLQREAAGFARAMHDVGLVSDYHADFLRWLLEQQLTDLLPDALGLSSTGIDSLRCYSDLVHALIAEAVTVATAQAVYALAMLLERGTLYTPAIAPGLWRQIGLELSAQAEATLAATFGTAVPARVHLLAGVISVLGQPLGVAQGNNPTCQSARAISLWAINDPDYLLYLIAQAAKFDRLRMEFEGQPLESDQLPQGLAQSVPADNDPVSTLLVPHLDRIYNEMGRLCAERPQDPHAWVNPEFHGWWVGRQFAIAVDVETGQLADYETFLRHFFASYHPLFNGNQPVIHPQPAGLAVTDSNGRFVGWHAISLLRVALDHEGTMRGYFYNPNNDSGQDWGQGVVVSTQGHGEWPGEASLPFWQLASRVYIFHDEPYAQPDLAGVPQKKVDDARRMALESWAADRGGD